MLNIVESAAQASIGKLLPAVSDRASWSGSIPPTVIGGLGVTLCAWSALILFVLIVLRKDTWAMSRRVVYASWGLGVIGSGLAAASSGSWWYLVVACLSLPVAAFMGIAIRTSLDNAK